MWMRVIHIALALSVLVLGLSVINFKKDRDYYKSEYSKIMGIRDNVMVVKYFMKDEAITSELCKLSLGQSYQIDFMPQDKVKLVRVNFFRGINNSMPDTPIEKSTPWGSLSIEDKMFLCAYGSSGNKLSEKDMKEIEQKYGSK